MSYNAREATNINRTLLTPQAGLPATANFITEVAEFKDGSLGSVQAVWTGMDVVDGTLELWASNFPEPATFSKYPNSKVALDPDCGGQLWNLGLIGFRFLLVKYTKGTATTGTIQVHAMSKKGG